MLIRNTGQSMAQELLASLQTQREVAAILREGYLAGVGYDGLIFRAPREDGQLPQRVILEISEVPMMTTTLARQHLARLTTLTDQDQSFETIYLLLTPAELTEGARRILSRPNFIIRSYRSFVDLCSQFWQTLSPDYVDPGITDKATQLIEALSAIDPGGLTMLTTSAFALTYLSICSVPNSVGPSCNHTR